jgi:Domain of unknown function (DUF1835)
VLDTAMLDTAMLDGAMLDGDYKTLHIRCGSDIQEKLAIANFSGDFLEFSDPYCQGPVPRVKSFAEFLDARTRFIADAYGQSLKMVRKRLERQYHQLFESYQYERIVLWFEHDAYDQLILVYLLYHFWRMQTGKGKQALNQQLELICIDRFAGVQPFVGLGQLSAVQLASLWPERQSVTLSQLSTGYKVWQALIEPTPETLFTLASAPFPDLPLLAPALLRHLQELPSCQDGLSLTQRLSLAILAEQQGAAQAGQVFRKLTFEQEPLPFLGDLQYWTVLLSLIRAPQPALRFSPETILAPWPERVLLLTPTGEALVAQRVNWLDLNPINRWVGGVHLTSGSPMWCWDALAQHPMLR